MSSFQVIVLGCRGGPFETNLSGYLIGGRESTEYIALDTGSLLGGMDEAVAQGTFADFPFSGGYDQKAIELLLHHVHNYLISHAHLDHILGMVINSQLEAKKRIYAVDETIDHLRDHIFNGKIWPNYGSEGKRALSLYEYQRLQEGQMVAIEGTTFTCTPFLLNHLEPCHSSAFLLESGGNYVLYFGDTRADEGASVKRLLPIWERVSPLMDEGRLKAMFLECSYAYTNEERDFFGHLDTHLMMQELSVLAGLCRSVKGLKVIVTHRKQTMLQGVEEPLLIERQLKELNHLGLEFIFPRQGERIVV